MSGLCYYLTKAVFRGDHYISLVVPSTLSNLNKAELCNFSNFFLAGYYLCQDLDGLWKKKVYLCLEWIGNIFDSISEIKQSPLTTKNCHGRLITYHHRFKRGNLISYLTFLHLTMALFIWVSHWDRHWRTYWVAHWVWH